MHPTLELRQRHRPALLDRFESALLFAHGRRAFDARITVARAIRQRRSAVKAGGERHGKKGTKQGHTRLL